MHVNRRIRQIGAVLMLPCCVLAAEIAGAQQPPQLVSNPYFAKTASPPVHIAASNAPAAIPTAPAEHVVYPAATPAARQSSTMPRGLPRNRAAALGAAVRVSTLDEAFRAGVPANDSPQFDASRVASAGAEPGRFIPSAVAQRMPSEAIGASASAIPTNSGVRRDPTLQPVVWLSDASATPAPSQVLHQANQTSGYAAARSDSSQAANPLRREFMTQPVSHNQFDGGEAVGNPLR